MKYRIPRTYDKDGWYRVSGAVSLAFGLLVGLAFSCAILVIIFVLIMFTNIIVSLEIDLLLLSATSLCLMTPAFSAFFHRWSMRERNKQFHGSKEQFSDAQSEILRFLRSNNYDFKEKIIKHTTRIKQFELLQFDMFLSIHWDDDPEDMITIVLTPIKEKYRSDIEFIKNSMEALMRTLKCTERCVQ